jgi:hypothetical protein
MFDPVGVYQENSLHTNEDLANKDGPAQTRQRNGNSCDDETRAGSTNHQIISAT